MVRILPILIAVTLIINSPYTLLFAGPNEAYVVSCQGDVRIIRAGTNVGYPCEMNMNIAPGDFIHTGPGSTATVGYVGATSFVTEIGEGSLVEILDGEPYWLDLSDGKIITSLNGVEKGKTFMVHTPVGACGARGTGWELTTNGINDRVKVFDSKVFYQWMDPYGEMSGEKDSVWINEGYEREIIKYEHPGEMEPLNEGELEMLSEKGVKMAAYIKTRSGIVQKGKFGVNEDGHR